MIKRLTSDDIHYAYEAIVNLKHMGDESIKKNLTHHYLRNFLSNPYNYLLVAIENTTVIGFLLAYRLQRVDRAQDSMYFYEIEVSRENQRNGIGTKLVEELKSICDRENIMKIWVETNRSNIAAVNLFDSAGGKEVSGDDIVLYTFNPPYTK